MANKNTKRFNQLVAKGISKKTGVPARGKTQTSHSGKSGDRPESK